MKNFFKPCIFALAFLPWPLVAENSPYVSKVYEFLPAPGQFTNVLPQYEAGDNAQTMADKAGAYIVGEENGTTISLGAWGGYIVAGFDHTIVNVNGEYDFKISGNAFYANPNAAVLTGSCEPGIVMVSRDENGNGLPDDAWYELAGSEHNSAATRKNYQVTYYKPAADKVPTPATNNASITDTSYIFWRDNQGGSGYVPKNSFHAQNYFPEWVADSVVFSGTRLPDNGVASGTSSVLYVYDWGYADNHPNTSELSYFKIDWAVDAAGQSVTLAGIDFVKVYTGVLQINGWLGENSTEISGITDLHLQSGLSDMAYDNTACRAFVDQTGNIIIQASKNSTAALYSPTGLCLAKQKLTNEQSCMTTSGLPNGIYVLLLQTATDQTVFKLIL